jgi:hypothetical protein
LPVLEKHFKLENSGIIADLLPRCL